MVSWSWFLLISGILIIFILIYLFLYSSLFRSGVYKTVKIPYSSIRSMKSAARNKRYETAYVYDYDPNTQQKILRPKQIKKSRGTNSAVRPRVDFNDEIVAHTHPKTTTKDPVLRAYENELRERPSATDVNFLLRDDNDNALLVTHSGKVITMRKTTPKDSSINLATEEKRIQSKVTRGELKSQKDASVKAQRVNREFIKITENKGVKITTTRRKGNILLRERVK